MVSSFAALDQPRVLLVDDAPEDRAALRRFLSKDQPATYRVDEAANVREARDSVGANRPDCVLLDFNLTDGDGLSLLREWVSAYGPHAFGIVMLTASGDASVAVQALQAGAHDYIEKNGLAASSLRRTVNNAIEKAAFQRQLVAQSAALAQKNDELAAHVQRLQHEMEERSRAEAAVRETAAQLRVVTDHLPVYVAQLDRDYRYRFANRRLAERFRLGTEELKGKTISEVIGTEAFSAFKLYMDRALAGELVDFETAAVIEGSKRWMRVNYVPERNTAGDVIGFVAVSSDITQRKHFEDELARARDQAVDASQARDHFLAALSHELRTPLNPVLLIASEAAANLALPEAVREDFSLISNHVALEARLIDDLLDLSRISHGKLSLQRARLGLHAVIRDALATMRAELEAKKIRFHLELIGPSPAVEGDAVRLQQVFWNVLKNAVKFTPMGGEVSLRCTADLQRVSVEIVDSGIGIAPEDLAFIFEAFSQGKHAESGSAHRFGGLGLGLAITRMLVELHSGKIMARSEGLDRGATFIVELPLAVASGLASPVPSVSPREAAKANGKSVDGHQQKVLVVEDHGPTRLSLQRLLGNRGYGVNAAATATEAEAMVRQAPFDVVISDIGLPDTDGYELMRSLRAIQPGLRGIALSGYGMEDDLIRAREAGFADHLTKPVKMEAIEKALVRVLAGAP